MQEKLGYIQKHLQTLKPFMSLTTFKKDLFMNHRSPLQTLDMTALQNAYKVGGKNQVGKKNLPFETSEFDTHNLGLKVTFWPTSSEKFLELGRAKAPTNHRKKGRKLFFQDQKKTQKQTKAQKQMVANRDFHYIFKRLKSAIAEKQQVVCKLHKPKKYLFLHLHCV